MAVLQTILMTVLVLGTQKSCSGPNKESMMNVSTWPFDFGTEYYLTENYLWKGYDKKIH